MPTWEIHITGSVQGVGFRPFIYRLASELQLTGNVQNRGNFVKVVIQGTSDQLQRFVEELPRKKPPLAFLERVEEHILDQPVIYDSFSIAKSSTDTQTRTTSYIPPDVAICDQCLDDMREGDRHERKDYSFTSCVDCGPRYSVIRGVPYDRPLTTMDQFPLCGKCHKEYTNPLDRRFHAQTTCCRSCGPTYELRDRRGQLLARGDSEVAHHTRQLLLGGSIVAIKGIGGTHLSCLPDRPDVIERLRSGKGDRKRKPFALMSASVKDIRRFAEVPSPESADMLDSFRRPIVILPRKEPFPLADNIGPGLDNVGVMLPYSGFHYQLLSEGLDTLVMTSANRSHLPIQVENEEIMRTLGDVAEYFVLHNRKIYQRVDDSVVKPLVRTSRLVGLPQAMFLRRSRGYTPEPLAVPFFPKTSQVVGVGAELHTVPAILTGGKVFPTQYIGNLRYEETYDFYRQAVRHLQGLLQNPPLEAIGHDLHPQLLSREFATELHDQTGAELMGFQHHYAHAAALLAEHERWDDQAVVVVADGLGYGADGNIWGGEVLLADLDEYERRWHLPYVPQPGGDLATSKPIRMVISYLREAGWEEDTIEEDLVRQLGLNPAIRHESRIVLQQIRRKVNAPLTSSTGRFLDACAVALGVADEASYEGEPAITLEGHGSKYQGSRNNPFVNEASERGLLSPPEVVSKLFELKKEKSTEFIAFAVQEYLGILFGRQALRERETTGVELVGFSGGVAYNDIITHSFLQALQSEGVDLAKVLMHKKLPPGDGCVAVGQAVLAARKKQ